MFCRFYHTLNNHSHLIVSGYSFGDKGINEKIIEWIYSGNKRMIIIDPFVDTLRGKIPTSLLRIWNDKHRVVQINDCIENILSEIFSRIPDASDKVMVYNPIPVKQKLFIPFEGAELYLGNMEPSSIISVKKSDLKQSLKIIWIHYG